MAQTDISNIDEKRFRAWLLGFFRQCWWQVAILSFFTMIGVGLELLNPWPLKLLADSVFGSVTAPGPLAPYTGTFTLLVFVAVSYVILYFLQSAVGMISGYIGARFNFNLDNKIKTNYFRHILFLPLRSSNRLKSSDYVYRLNGETGSIPGLILGTSVAILQSLLTIFGVLIILLLLDWQMTVLSLTIIPLLYLSVIFFGNKLEAKSLEVEEAYSDIYDHTTESIENADIVQSFNRQDGQIKKLAKLLNKRLRLELSSAILGGEFGFTNSSLTVIAITVIVIIGGKRVFEGALTFGDLLIFVTYAGQLYSPLEALSGAIGGMRDSLGSIRRVYQVVADHEDLENTATGKVIPAVSGQITFDRISFSYGDKQILDQVSFKVKPGEKVAFIGPSGSGKSTLLSLLPRFGIPDSGFIYLDNQEIHEINLNSLREQMAIVAQEPKLFSITIGENIGFAHPDEEFPLPDVMAAAKSAFATDFIEKLPQKYQTQVMNSGDSLSGGQKQRIAIARAFFKKAPILVLDEPTSAQDVASEARVLDGINNLMEGKTVLMVTHKHSLLSQMDSIYVIENGKLHPISYYGGLDAYERYLQMHEIEQ